MGKCEVVIQVVEFQFVIGALALGKRFLSQVCNNVLFVFFLRSRWQLIFTEALLTTLAAKGIAINRIIVCGTLKWQLRVDINTYM